MTARRMSRRTLGVALVIVLAALAISSASASAAPPSVSLNALSSPTNETAPAFSGFASDTTPVTVYIFEGGSVEGTPFSTATASGTGGAWSSGEAAPALPDGSYTAVAGQPSSTEGEGEGFSDPIHFTILTSAPKVTLNGLASPSGESEPSFSGTAGDHTPIAIQIYRGSQPEGELVATAGATGTGGGWSSGHLSPALASGEYTAVAEQESSLLGNPTGVSNSITFVVDTSSPTVTLDGVATPSNDSTPTFSGTASDTTTVVVHVLDGAEKEVAFATGAPSGGKWKSGGLSKSLPTGSYTAVATEASSLGNPEGTSSTISFVVNVDSPQVTLDQPASRSSDTTPSFSGSATDTTPVTVEIFKGSSASGSQVATATADGTGGGWASGAATPALSSGTYTALAVQESSFGNPEGQSEPRTFVIDTSAPAVTVNAPSSPSNDTTPSFSGTASETSQVVVHVISQSGSPHQVAQLTATPSGGSWSTTALGSALPDGDYTVLATEKSTIGNAEGRSEELPFTVNTASPKVTLASIDALSNNQAPSFNGTATDTTTVTVSIYSGSIPSGTAAATATATPGGGGAWSSTGATPALPDGEYTAVAREPSSLGNPEGESKAVKFTVRTTPPTVTLAAVPSPSNNRSPAFSGTASDSTTVEVTVFDEASHAVATATANPSGGKWKSPALSPSLLPGEHTYTAVATQSSSIGNPPGESAAIAFTVDTNPPTVTLEPVASPSNNRAPSFAGTASDTSTVEVSVYAGTKTTGAPEATATATPSAGAWSTGSVKALRDEKRTYTAVARQKSSLGNPEGASEAVTFIVDPEAPTIAMTPPPAQIASATPTFSGSASEPTSVSVVICRAEVGCGAESHEWIATGAGPGAWTAISPALIDGSYEAIATQRSLTGALGATKPYPFIVDTTPPKVTLTGPANGATVQGSSVLVQGAAGTAPHDRQSIAVQLYAGTSIASGQSPVQSLVVGSSAGAWSATLGGLSSGSYTVRAQQSDEAGNLAVSSAATFVDQPAGAAGGPSASFVWYPAKPHTGERVSLVSTSTDGTMPLVGYAWDLLGTGFSAGAQTQSTSFSSPGTHAVSLRVTDGAGGASVVTEPIGVTYPFMKPFPTVRIVTTHAVGHVRLKVLSVQAPAGATVQVSCVGKRCPIASQTKTVPKAKSSAVPPIAFARLERSLQPGIVLQIRVYKAGRIGKFTSFAIRKGKLPVRTDSCLSSTAPRPVACS
jgi:hypothetical protein